MEIDPQTRDIVQNACIRRLERVGSRLQNVEFFVYCGVPDPASGAASSPARDRARSAGTAGMGARTTAASGAFDARLGVR